MKTKDELNALKEEVETLNKKLMDLTEEELEQVSGGNIVPPVIPLPVPGREVPVPQDIFNSGDPGPIFG